MKTTLLFKLSVLAITLMAAQAGYSQSLEAIDPQEVVMGTVEDELLQESFDIRNNSEITVFVKVRREEISVVEGTLNYFCWFQCYTPNTSVSPTSLAIAPGQSVPNFYADYQPYGIAGSSFIKYCFYDENNPSDETCVIIEYRVSDVTSVNNAELVSVGNPQPNPASDVTKIPYVLRESNKGAALVVYNILGSEIKRQSVSGTSGTITLDVSDLQSGVYIYSFYNDNRLLASSRLVVR